MNYSMFIKELGGCKRDIAKPESKSGKKMWVVVSDYLAAENVAVRTERQAYRIFTKRLEAGHLARIYEIN